MKNKRDLLKSPRLAEMKKKKRASSVRKASLFFLLSLAVLLGLAFLSRSKVLLIKSINVSGNTIIESEEIIKETEINLAGKYLGIFPRNNIFIYPKRTIEKNLPGKFKRIMSISISLGKDRILYINLKERKGEYLWCGSGTPEVSQKLSEGKCYFIDSEGYIFDEAPSFSGSVYFKFYGGNISAGDNPLGRYLFVPEEFKKLVSFKDSLSKIGIKPEVFYREDDDNYKIYLSSVGSSGIGPEIIFKKENDFEKIFNNLESALSTEPFASEFKKKYQTLIYMDLRYQNKVYYKFTGK